MTLVDDVRNSAKGDVAEIDTLVDGAGYVAIHLRGQQKINQLPASRTVIPIAETINIA